jgi:hypothetical protein
MRIGCFMEFLSLGAIRLLSGLHAQSCMQNAPEYQDPVATRQDGVQTSSTSPSGGSRPAKLDMTRPTEKGESIKDCA